jgi:hypothetical protein
LKRISISLQFNRLDFILIAVSDLTDNWSGRTRNGECLHGANEQYGKECSRARRWCGFLEAVLKER